MKRRLFPHGSVTRHCHRPGHGACPRLARRKNQPFHPVAPFRKQATRPRGTRCRDALQVTISCLSGRISRV